MIIQSANGLGLQAITGKDYSQRDPKIEGLSFKCNLCEVVTTWEQVRNSTTILTREFIDALPNGREEMREAQPRTVIALRKANLEEPKLNQPDPSVAIPDNSSSNFS
ncbi:hypothetical protein DITRI_Ditri10aG0074200 [Diplodiscus trichospermus]